MIYLYTCPLWLPALLFVEFLIFALCTRKGWATAIIVAELIAAPLDVFLNYTEFALMTWDWPVSANTEGTLSLRLARLQHNTDWRGTMARPVVAVLNYFLPGHIG